MVDFEKYDRENPIIWEHYEKVTFQTIAKGFSHYSSMGVMQIVRWTTKASGNDGYKVNNNYVADYARKFMEKHPQHKGFFRTRSMKARRLGTPKPAQLPLEY